MTLPEQAAESEGVWPENRWSVAVFSGMLTQWRMGPMGPVGLDYSAHPTAEREARVPRRERRDAYAGMRVMERAWLDYFAERSDG